MMENTNEEYFNACLVKLIETKNIKRIRELLINLLQDNILRDQLTFSEIPLVHLATRIGDKALFCLEKLLQSKIVDINAIYSGGTALSCSCSGDHKQIVNLLIQHGADVNLFNDNNDTPLHIACRNNCLSNVIKLVENGAFVNAEGHYGITPLHLAVKSSNVKMCNYLLRHGADVTAQGYKFPLPLHIACKKGDLKMILVLVNHMHKTVNPFNVTSLFGETALFYAVSSRSVETVIYLLSKCADPNIASNDYLLPLHSAAQQNCELYDIIHRQTNSDAILKYCTFPGPNGPDSTNRSILCLAIGTGDVALIEKVLKTGLPTEVLNCPTICYFSSDCTDSTCSTDGYFFSKTSIYGIEGTAILFSPLCYYLLSYCKFNDADFDVLKMLMHFQISYQSTFKRSDTDIFVYNIGPIETILRSEFTVFGMLKLIYMLLEKGVDADDESTESPPTPIKTAFIIKSSRTIIMLLITQTNRIDPEGLLRWIIDYKKFQEEHVYSVVDEEIVERIYVTQDIIYILLVLSPYFNITQYDYNYFMSLPCSGEEINVSEKIRHIREQPVRSLASYCRSVIREELHYVTRDNPKQFIAKLNALPLPEAIISYLKFGEIKYTINENCIDNYTNVICEIE